jgi:hypothetical protein
MERVTFPDPKVKEALAKFELCQLDVDAPADRELCARLQRGGGTPTFVALGTDGVELSRWVGAFEADELVAKLTAAKDDTAARLLAAGDDHGTLAEIHAARGDLEPTLQELAALSAGGGADAAAVVERVSWLLCTTLQDQQRWPDLERAARHYLERCSDGAHAVEARVALGLTTFAKTGTTTPELQAHVDRLVTVLGVPSPKRSLYDRFWRSLGAPNEASEQAQDQALGEWVDRLNATTDELTRLGRAALPALHRALRDGDHETAENAATVIGRIRDPESHAFLRDLLDHAELDTARRTQVVGSLGMYRDAADLPRMVALASSDAAPGLRAEAVDAIQRRCALTEGTTDRAIADTLSGALESHDLALRMATLQAMFKVHAPLALDRLLDAMDDERLMFLDVRVCDNALWIFNNQIDRNVVDRDDLAMLSCTPAVAAYLSRWYADARTHLRWDATQGHWVDDRDPQRAR